MEHEQQSQSGNLASVSQQLHVSSADHQSAPIELDAISPARPRPSSHLPISTHDTPRGAQSSDIIMELPVNNMEPTEAERRSNYLPERMYPISRPQNIARLHRYAPWSKKADKGWALSWSDWAVLPTAATSKGNRVIPLSELKDNSAPIDCPWCKTKSETIIRKEMGSQSNMMICLCCLCCGVLGAVVPCIFDLARDSEHFCGHCGVMVAQHSSGASGSRPVIPNAGLPVSQYQKPQNMEYDASKTLPSYEESNLSAQQRHGGVNSLLVEAAGRGMPPASDEKRNAHGETFELSGVPMESGSKDLAGEEKQTGDVEEVAGGENAAVSATEDRPSPVSPPTSTVGVHSAQEQQSEAPNPPVSPLLR